MDFDAFVLRMKEAGAFTPYPTPLGTTDGPSIHHSIRNPEFPGEMSYGNGPGHIAYDTLLPNDLIRAQNQSIRDALKHYLPEPVIQSWMKEFFSGNFMKSPAYQKLVTTLMLPDPDSRINLPEELTLQLDHPDRCRSDRRMFSKQEKILTREICMAVPQIVASVIGYQAAFLEYLNRLEDAIERSPAVTQEEKHRAHETLSNMTLLWRSENMIENFIPAIALHYQKNHAKLGEPPTEQDFTEAMDFIVRNGAFGHKIRHYQGEERTFTCPARQILMATSALDLQLFPLPDGQERSHKPGSMLAEIAELSELQMRSGCLGQFTSWVTGNPKAQLSAMMQRTEMKLD